MAAQCKLAVWADSIMIDIPRYLDGFSASPQPVLYSLNQLAPIYSSQTIYV